MSSAPTRTRSRAPLPHTAAVWAALLAVALIAGCALRAAGLTP